MTKLDLQKKRRQLRAIQAATNSIKHGRISPRTGAAIVAFVVGAIAAGPALDLGLPGVTAAAIAFATAGYLFLGFPKTWADDLDIRLSKYEPVNESAYLALHKAATAGGGLSDEAVSEWLGLERQAVTERLEQWPEGTGSRFLRKDVSGARPKKSHTDTSE